MPQTSSPLPVRPRLAPLELFAGEDTLLSPQAQRRWLLALMALGIVLRITRYLLRFPLWEDEAMLSANLIDRGYAELLRPLHYCQVAPTLFLWGQLALTRLLGFNEYALRLVPFLCGMGSLLLFRHVAGQLLRGVSLVLAVGLFAVAYPMTRYAAEAKPYGCDLFVSLAMLALAVQWLRRTDQARWLWFLAAVAGPAIGYSFPAMFVAGGISLVVGWTIVSGTGHRRAALVGVPNTLLAWLAFNAAILASVAAVLVVSREAVGATNQQTMEETHWADTFPPLAQPLKLPLWLLKTHAGAMLGYPVGGPNFGSTFSMLCVVAGVAVLARRRQWLPMALLLAPLGLNFVAASMHKFPYGGHARMTLFLAPALCMLIALGLAGTVAWIEGRWRRKVENLRANGIVIALGLLAILGCGSWFRDVTHPYKSATTLRAREFAQWFWFELAHDGELVSCETDLGADMSPGKLNCGWSSLYFCNQRIYSPRHARRDPPQWSQVSAERPLRCVLYRSPEEERQSPNPDPQARRRLLEQIESEHNVELAAYDTYPFAAYDKWDGQKKAVDYIEVFKFVPKGAGTMAARAKELK